MTETLAERDAVMAAVAGLLETTANGHGRALFVIGEAGPALGRYFCTVLGRLRAQATGPLLLALDDAHWADSGSLTLLRLICRWIGALPVAVLVTARPWPPDVLRAGEELAGQCLLRSAS